MILERLKGLLEEQGVRYQAITHQPAYTSQQTAESVHVRAGEFAKTVMVWLDARLVMAVVPATHKVDLALLEHAAGAIQARLASESEFTGRFPGCEPGAMPPFGNLYGIDVYVDNELAERASIVFNAGSHRDLIRMDYRDFDRLVRPRVARLAHEAPGPALQTLALTAPATEIMDLFATGGQAACSSDELRNLLSRPTQEIDAGLTELERHGLVRTGYSTAEECGYELTPAGRHYIATGVYAPAR